MHISTQSDSCQQQTILVLSLDSPRNSPAFGRVAHCKMIKLQFALIFQCVIHLITQIPDIVKSMSRVCKASNCWAELPPSSLDIAISLPGISARKENILDRTYESAVALATRTTGPLADQLGPWYWSLTRQSRTHCLNRMVICGRLFMPPIFQE